MSHPTTLQTSPLVHTCCLVGDRFAGFATQDGVMTVAGFVAELRRGTYDDVPGPLRLVGGQGVGTYEWDYVRRELHRRGIAQHVIVEDHSPPAAGRHEVHKQRSPNVLLAGLTRIDDRTYRAALCLHNDNELLLDHVSGQHVQGMVIIEAARQMFLAVTERFFAPRNAPRNYYYVINTLAVTFANFLFPVKATIEYIVERAELDQPDRLGFTAQIVLWQAGQPAAETRVEFTAFDVAVLSEKEARRAQAALAGSILPTSDPLAVRRQRAA